jgi:hypothetical protein
MNKQELLKFYLFEIEKVDIKIEALAQARQNYRFNQSFEFEVRLLILENEKNILQNKIDSIKEI